MRRRHLPALAALALLGAACGGGGGGAAASCVAPYLDTQPPGRPAHDATVTLAPGDSVTVHGHWYTSTCNDTGGHDALMPLPPVHLTLTLPGGAVQQLGTFSPAGEDLGFATLVQVPADAPAGTATVSDDRDPAAHLVIRIGG